MSRPPLPRSTSSSAAAASPLRTPPRSRSWGSGRRGRSPEHEHQTHDEQAADAAADPESPKGVGLRGARWKQRRADHACLKSSPFQDRIPRYHYHGGLWGVGMRFKNLLHHNWLKAQNCIFSTTSFLKMVLFNPVSTYYTESSPRFLGEISVIYEEYENLSFYTQLSLV